MDITSKTFLAVLKGTLSGETVDPGREVSPEEWQKLFDLARIHQVLPLFYNAVYPYVTAPLGTEIRQSVRVQVMRQAVKTSEFLALNQQLQAVGVKPLVMKGLICRELYPQPDLRPSGDEDVLIPADQFFRCHRVLRDFGMETRLENPKDSYEVPYRKPESPLYIELHKHLFPPESAAYGDLNRFFKSARERAVAEEIQGHTVYTMDYTDHLFYLICHAFKHFLHSGFGIRQVCDIILFANRYGCRVDWQRILKNCREIHADKFAAAVLQIGSKYLVFDPEKAAYPAAWRKIRVDERAMLEDILSGGLYGDSNMSRKHSSNITLEAVVSRKQGKKARHSVIASVFPAAGKLEGRYPYLKKNPWLVPVAWCDRLWHYSRETGKNRENNAAESLRIGKERVALMREYGIVE